MHFLSVGGARKSGEEKIQESWPGTEIFGKYTFGNTIFGRGDHSMDDER